MLSAYFRDVALKRTMLELLPVPCDSDPARGQHRAGKRKFGNFDIECVDVLIGKPGGTEQAGGKIETLLEQLRLRQLSLEQVETYTKQVSAAQTLRTLNGGPGPGHYAPACSSSNSLVQIRIAENEAEALLARARKQAEQVVVTAEAESEQRILAGRGEGARILQEGFSEASVLLRKIQSFSDPRLYALSIVAQGLSKCNQPLVPERIFISGGTGSGGSSSDGQDQRFRAARRQRSPSACCSTCWWPRNPDSSLSISPAVPTSRSLPKRSPSRRWKRSRQPWIPTGPQPSTTATALQPLRRRGSRHRRC